MLRLTLHGMTIKEKIILNNDLFGYVRNILIIFYLLIYLIYRWTRMTVWERARAMHRRIKYYNIYKTVLKN